MNSRYAEYCGDDADGLSAALNRSGAIPASRDRQRGWGAVILHLHSRKGSVFPQKPRLSLAGTRRLLARWLRPALGPALAAHTSARKCWLGVGSVIIYLSVIIIYLFLNV